MVLRDINPYYMNIASDEIILSFIRVIALDKMSCCVVHRITKFLKHMAVPYGQPIRKNQELILNEMLAVANKYRVELFDVRRYRADPRPELLSLIDEFSRSHTVNSTLLSADIADVMVKNMKLLYHAECIEILALCCHGHRATLSARCQLILPLDMVIEVLSRGSTYSCPPIALAYGLFLRHVYLDTDTDISRMPIGDGAAYMTEFKPMWEACSHFSAFAGDRGNLEGPFRPFVFLVALPCLQMFLSAYINDQTSAANALQDDGDAYADVIMLQTKRIVSRLLNETGLSRRESHAVIKIASALGVSARDFAVRRDSNAESIINDQSRPVAVPEVAGSSDSASAEPVDTGTTETPSSVAIEMASGVGGGGSIHRPDDSVEFRAAGFASSFRKGSFLKTTKTFTDEQTEEFIASLASHCPRIKKVLPSFSFL
jgi:hypothetical protein